MLRFVSDHLETKNMCKYAAKNFPFAIRYVPARYKLQETCDNVILENGGTLIFVPDWYKNQKLCKYVDNYAHALEFVPHCCKTKCAIKPLIFILLQYSLFMNTISIKKYLKSVDTCPFVFDSVPHRNKTQERYDKVVSKDTFMLKYCLDRYKTLKICNIAVDTFLPTLEFVPDWFVTSKMIKKLYDDLFSNDDIVLVNEDSNCVILFSDEMGVRSVDLTLSEGSNTEKRPVEQNPKFEFFYFKFSKSQPLFFNSAFFRNFG